MSRATQLLRDNSRRRWLVGSILGMSLVMGAILFATNETPADALAPQPSDRYVAKMVTSLLDNEHLLKHPLDDEISHRALDTYLKMLDPQKLYFLQADIDEFSKSRDRIDDYVISGNLAFAYTLYSRYLQRVDERTKDIPALVQAPHDFSIDENMDTDAEAIPYAKDAAEVHERWRKRIKYELLVRLTDNAKLAEESAKPESDTEGRESAKKPETEDQIKARIVRRYENYAKVKHQASSDELLEMFLTAVTSSYDPHTTYMSAESLNDFNIQMKLNLEGIGAALQVEDGYTVVSKIIKGGGADKSGELQPEDRIVSVGQGEAGEMEDVIDMKLRDVVQKIRGPAGSTVRLGVIPAGSTETKIYTITRARVELKDQEARGEIIEQTIPSEAAVNPPGGNQKLRIGYIDLPSFYMDMSGARQGFQDFKSTTRDVRKILDDFNAKKVDLVILNLRENGGGSLTEAINLTGLFIDNGPVVQVKDSAGKVQHYDDTERGMAWSGPLVVLTDKFSASASEILAGAIQDYGRGIIVGDETTHGKGTVQSLLDLGAQLLRVPNPPNYGALKITMQQFYRPNGDSTQKRGVLADLNLPSLTSQFDIGEDDLDYAIEFDRVEAARFSGLGQISQPLLADLRKRSETRRGTNADFEKLAKNIERYREQKERKYVTLNRDKYLAQRAELDAEQAEEKHFKEQLAKEDGPVFQRNFYNDEVLAIAADYFELMKKYHIAKLD